MLSTISLTLCHSWWLDTWDSAIFLELKKPLKWEVEQDHKNKSSCPDSTFFYLKTTWMKESLQSHACFHVCWLGVQVSECWCLGSWVSEQVFCFWSKSLKFKLLICHWERKKRKSPNHTSKLLVPTSTRAFSIQNHAAVCELWPLAKDRSWKDCLT